MMIELIEMNLSRLLFINVEYNVVNPIKVFNKEFPFSFLMI